MAPDVWAWADGCTEAKACAMRRCNHRACGNCETHVAELMSDFLIRHLDEFAYPSLAPS